VAIPKMCDRTTGNQCCEFLDFNVRETGLSQGCCCLTIWLTAVSRSPPAVLPVTGHSDDFAVDDGIIQQIGQQVQ